MLRRQSIVLALAVSWTVIGVTAVLAQEPGDAPQPSESKMGGKLVKSRSTIELLSPDSATMKSEMSVDGGPWALVMELKGNRSKQAR